MKSVDISDMVSIGRRSTSIVHVQYRYCAHSTGIVLHSTGTVRTSTGTVRTSTGIVRTSTGTVHSSTGTVRVPVWEVWGNVPVPVLGLGSVPEPVLCKTSTGIVRVPVLSVLVPVLGRPVPVLCNPEYRYCASTGFERPGTGTGTSSTGFGSVPLLCGTYIH